MRRLSNNHPVKKLTHRIKRRTPEFDRSILKRPQFLLFVFGFAIIGSYLIFQSLAAVNFLKVEAEAIAPIGNATRVAAANASGTGNNVVQFGAASSTVPILYQAEDAAHDPNSIVETKSSGTVLGSFGHQGQFVTFTVRVDNTGDYAASLRYAAADGTATKLDPLPRTLLINNVQVRTINFPRTSSGSDQWDTLTTKSIDTLHLTGGTPNTVTFRIDTTQEGYWDVDYLEVAGASGTTPPPTPNPPPPNPTPTPPNPPPSGSYSLPAYNIPGNAVYVNNGNELSNAVNSASAGAVIVLRNGSYGDYELNGKNPGGWIRIIGDPAGGRISVGSFKLVDSSYIELRHLRLTGNGQVANKAVEVHGGHHFRIYDNEIFNGGEAGISFPGNQGNGGSDHIDIRYNDIHDSAHNSNQGYWQGSGLSILFSQDRGVEDVVPGYKILIAGNRIWNNYIDPVISGGINDPWGVTDGNCIIIDVNHNSNYQGRTLITENVCSDNGGAGTAITNSSHVDIVSNSYYHNDKTRIESVWNNGEIMCAGGDGSSDVKVIDNIVVPGDYNANLFQTFGSLCNNYSLSNNVWVRTGYPSQGSGDITLPSNSAVFASPNLNASLGNWAPQGQAVGHGAQWPQ